MELAETRRFRKFIKEWLATYNIMYFLNFILVLSFIRRLRECHNIGKLNAETNVANYQENSKRNVTCHDIHFRLF